MFTKEDYRSYFDGIAVTERSMIYQAKDIIVSLKDPVIINSLNGVMEDEIRHYSLVMSIINRLLPESEVEKRIFIRRHSLGTARLKLRDGREFSAYCIDISERGICIEHNNVLPEDESFEIWVDFFDGSGPIHRDSGLIKWSVEIGQVSQITSINYRSGLERMP